MVLTGMTYVRRVKERTRKGPCAAPLLNTHCSAVLHIVFLYTISSLKHTGVVGGGTMAKFLSLNGGGWSIASGDGKHAVEGTVPGYALQALVEAGKEEDPLKGCVSTPAGFL